VNHIGAGITLLNQSADDAGGHVAAANKRNLCHVVSLLLSGVVVPL
jgi:hypothetical protein